MQRFKSQVVANCPSLGESPDEYPPFSIISIDNGDQNSCNLISMNSKESAEK
jgi:hypothetical protein